MLSRPRLSLGCRRVVPAPLTVLLLACHRQGVMCCAAAVVIPPWRGHCYRSGPAMGWCLNYPPLLPPPQSTLKPPIIQSSARPLPSPALVPNKPNLSALFRCKAAFQRQVSNYLCILHVVFSWCFQDRCSIDWPEQPACHPFFVS